MKKWKGEALLEALESGELRVAQRDDSGLWQTQAWVKEAILDLFRESDVGLLGSKAAREFWPFVDKQIFGVRAFGIDDGVRLVPGGSSVRRGAHVGRGCVLMPPCYLNVGAFVGAGSMVDSHALVGSCAQIGERVHISAAAQIGGVLEPAGRRPVIVEDDVLVGGQSGLYEGVLVRERAVIGAGVVLTASTRVFDLVHERELKFEAGAGLEIPAEAVVVPGSRPAKGGWANGLGLNVNCALIVKYRDASTDRATELEQALR